jgi:hypothetical protein
LYECHEDGLGYWPDGALVVDLALGTQTEIVRFCNFSETGNGCLLQSENAPRSHFTSSGDPPGDNPIIQVRELTTNNTWFKFQVNTTTYSYSTNVTDLSIYNLTSVVASNCTDPTTVSPLPDPLPPGTLNSLFYV